MKWHEACLSISAAILEILNAWENGVLTFESIQVGLVGRHVGQSRDTSTVLCPGEGLGVAQGRGLLFSYPERCCSLCGALWLLRDLGGELQPLDAVPNRPVGGSGAGTVTPWRREGFGP